MTDTIPGLLPLEQVQPSLQDLAAHVAQLSRTVRDLGEGNGVRSAGKDDSDGEEPLYDNVEDWVRLYLLPTFPRPFGETGMVRWRWCEQWWRHDEAVTRLTALWYGWEHARVQVLGMQPWLRDLDYHLQILCGDDGPFRNCAPGRTDVAARHDMPTIAVVRPAPPEWWSWWDDDDR